MEKSKVYFIKDITPGNMLMYGKEASNRKQ